jgi:hypothetical protein
MAFPWRNRAARSTKRVQALVGEQEDVAFGAQDAISPLTERVEM